MQKSLIALTAFFQTLSPSAVAQTPAQAELTFPLKIGEYSTMVDCAKLDAKGALTNEFLVTLEAGFHQTQSFSTLSHTWAASQSREQILQSLGAHNLTQNHLGFVQQECVRRLGVGE